MGHELVATRRRNGRGGFHEVAGAVVEKDDGLPGLWSAASATTGRRTDSILAVKKTAQTSRLAR